MTRSILETPLEICRNPICRNGVVHSSDGYNWEICPDCLGCGKVVKRSAFNLSWREIGLLTAIAWIAVVMFLWAIGALHP